MGNSLYRVAPRKIFNSSCGNSSNFEFAANQITGWRNTQEDRYVCLPNFREEFSFFAVYDGHGGEDVVQYLERFLHHFIYSELELTKDVELALYLSFLNCDSSLRSISEAEHTLIENDLVKEFEVPDRAERRRVLFGSTDDAGTSGGNVEQNDLRAAIASACIKELPSISYLTQAPVQESDESDDDYKPGDKDINYLMDSSDEKSQSSDSSESDDDSTDSKKNEENPRNTGKEFVEEKGQIVQSEDKDSGKQIGENCGSTATVVLINDSRIYIAHVGDSRCVACIKGQAVDLSTDHKPTDKEELERIINAGGSVSDDGRINGDIDMSRAFGDFRYKALDNPFPILSVEPSVSSLEISPDLEFIVIASDGIWNTMDSIDVIDYIKRRVSDPSLELQDLCGELFEELLPEKVTSDGSGCDNMTTVIIKFKSTIGISHNNLFVYQEIYEYRYPPANSKSKNSITKENLVKKEVEGSSQLKLDEKKYEEKNFPESSEESKGDDSEFDGKEAKDEDLFGFSKKNQKENIFSESSEESKQCYESGSNENESNCEFSDEMEFEGNSSSSVNSVEVLDYLERIPTNQEQQLPTSNKDYSDLATVMAAQPNQQKMSQYKSSMKHSSQLEGNNCDSNLMENNRLESRINNQSGPHQHANNAQHEGNYYNPNVLQNCRQELVNNNQSNPLEHASNMIRVMQSIAFMRESIQCLHSKLTCVETLVLKEIRRFNGQHLNSFPYPPNLNDTVVQPPMLNSVNLIDLTDEDTQRNDHSDRQNEVVSQVDSVVVQAPTVLMETDGNNLADKNIQNPKQSDEKGKYVNEVVQSPSMQREAEFIDFPSKEAQIPKQSASKEIVPKRIKNRVFQSKYSQILKNSDNPPNEKVVNPEQHYKKDEVVNNTTIQSLSMQMKTASGNRDEDVECAVIQSSTMPIGMDPVDIDDKDIQLHEHSIEKVEVVESKIMESPSLLNVANLVDITNEEIQTPKSAVSKNNEEIQTPKSAVSKNNEEIIRNLCHENTPTKKRDDFHR